MTEEKKLKAIALHYDRHHKQSTPTVIAKGEGEVAKKIIKTAKDHGIPLQQDIELTELLAKIELNEAIPRALYLAVAELLVFIYYLETKKQDPL